MLHLFQNNLEQEDQDNNTKKISYLDVPISSLEPSNQGLISSQVLIVCPPPPRPLDRRQRASVPIIVNYVTKNEKDRDTLSGKQTDNLWGIACYGHRFQ